MNKLQSIYYHLVTLLALTFFVSCTQNPNSALDKLKNERDSLSHQLQAQQKTTDSLFKNLESQQIQQGYPILFGRDFSDIANPEEFIKSSLREQTELIPLEAVLGGTMAFRRVEILSEKWVMATYDDGHIQGQAIYEYHLSPDDSLEFTIALYNHP